MHYKSQCLVEIHIQNNELEFNNIVILQNHMGTPYKKFVRVCRQKNGGQFANWFTTLPLHLIIICYPIWRSQDGGCNRVISQNKVLPPKISYWR